MWCVYYEAGIRDPDDNSERDCDTKESDIEETRFPTVVLCSYLSFALTKKDDSSTS